MSEALAETTTPPEVSNAARNLYCLPEVRESQALCMANVEPVQIDYLWKPRIPLGKLTFLAGDPGCGKSFMTAELAAAISTGRQLPGESRSGEGSVLFFIGEDSPEDTLRPRLEAAGASLDRIHAVVKPLSLHCRQDVEQIRFEIERYRPALVVVDPLVVYLGGKVDMHRANEVRSVVAPLAELAHDHDCAVLVVHHLSKGRGPRASLSLLGSVDFTAAARSVLLAGALPSDPESRVLFHVKSNTAAHAPALAYEVCDGVFSWAGECDLRVDDVLGGGSEGEEDSRLDDAKRFLQNELAGGPLEVSAILDRALRAGISERTLRRGKRDLRVVSLRTQFQGSVPWALKAPRRSL